MKKIALGFYDGIGDLVCALPLVALLISSGYRVTIFVTPKLRDILKLVNFSSGEIKISYFNRLNSMGISSGYHLLKALINTEVDFFWVSPHAMPINSSRYIPFLLKFFSIIFWRGRVQIIGSKSDKYSSLYDMPISIDYRENIYQRELNLLRALDLAGSPDFFDVFHRDLKLSVRGPIDIVIHPGASRKNKKLSDNFYSNLLLKLNPDLSVFFVGLPEDIPDVVRQLIPSSRIVEGDIASVISLFRNSKVVITMDSGFGHVASMVAKNHICVFGSTNIFSFAPASKHSVIFTATIKPLCMPCDSYECSQPELLCMESISVDDLIHLVGFMLLKKGLTGFSEKEFKSI